MGFVFGLMIGSAMSGSPHQMQAMLSAIPLRCFAALDESDRTYKDCRRPSLMRELDEQSSKTCGYIWSGRKDISGPWVDAARPTCDVDAMLTLEIKALRQIAEAYAKSR